MTTLAEATEVMARASRELDRLRGIIADMLTEREMAECALVDGDVGLADEKLRAIKARAEGYESAPDA